MDLAHKHGRKVALVGRSIDNSTEIAQDLGYIDPPQGLIIHPGEIKNTPANKLCILISGTQGEPMSALSRAAVDNHKFAKIDPGDTVLLSSRVIPGNEKAIYRVIDHLERRDARVIHDDGTNGLIHVSGHGSQEELRMMINLVRPKFFIPIHGDYRHLKRHVELAQATGVPEKVMLLEDGDVLTVDKDTAEKTGKVTTGRVCIDNNSTADVVEDTVIRDRKHLGEDGVFLPIIAINKRTGQVEGAPEITTRGFAADDPELLRNARDIVARTLEQSSEEERRDYGVMKDKIRGDLKRFLQKNANRRPLIMPIILEL
jgi:ribonuclease J